MADNLKSKVLRSLGWSAVDRWLTRIISLVVLIVLARLLDPKSFGILAAALIFIGYLELFVSQGIEFSIIQGKNLKQQNLNAAFWLNAGSGALLMIFLWPLSRIVAHLFSIPDFTLVLAGLRLSGNPNSNA